MGAAWRTAPLIQELVGGVRAVSTRERFAEDAAFFGNVASVAASTSDGSSANDSDECCARLRSNSAVAVAALSIRTTAQIIMMIRFFVALSPARFEEALDEVGDALVPVLLCQMKRCVNGCTN